MNIWIVKIGEPLESNMRNYILAEELTKRGHNVTYFTSGFNHQQKKWIKRAEGSYTTDNGISMEIINGCGYKKNFSIRRYVDHKMIAWKFKRRIQEKNKPDLILSSLPPHFLVSVSVEYGKENDVPVIVDIRDPWPDIIVEKLPFFLSFLLSKDVQNTRRALSDATALVSVSSDLLAWGLKKADRKREDRDKVFYLGAKKMNNVSLKAQVQSFFEENKNTIGYLGSFGENADPTLVLEFAEKNPSYGLILIGDGSLRENLQRKYGHLKNVFFTGWLSPEEVSAILKRCRLGVCPTKKDAYLLPNKIFTYLSAGLPIVSAYGGEAKDLIENNNLGFYYQKDNPEDFAGKVKGVRPEMSVNALNIFEENFDAQNIYTEYATYLEKYAKDH